VVGQWLGLGLGCRVVGQWLGLGLGCRVVGQWLGLGLGCRVVGQWLDSGWTVVRIQEKEIAFKPVGLPFNVKK